MKFESEIKERLEAAKKLTDLSAENKDILIQLIELELNDTLQGCYAGIPNEVYHHELCPGYSSTIIKRILEQSFNHRFVNKSGDDSSFRFGSAFHCFNNEPENFKKYYAISQFESRRGNDFKKYSDDCKKMGKTILLNKDFELLKLMSAKLHAHPDSSALIRGAQCELTYFSKDSQTGLWKKCKVDGIKGRSIYDLKTCQSAAPTYFIQDARKFLYRISGSYYCEIVTEVTGERHDEFNLIACEKDEPNEIAVYPIHEQSLEKAQGEIRSVLDKILKIKLNPESAWRGYDLGKQKIVI